MEETSLLQRVKSPQYSEPLSLYQNKLSCQKWKCKHEEVCKAILIFRLRWARLNPSLEKFWQSDFQVKLTIETCLGLRDFQNEKNIVDRIQQGFKLPRSCLFPLNNAYVGNDDVVSGVKFVVSKEEEAEKLKPFFQDYDYLFFAQNLDILTKTCSGGLLFLSGQTLVGVMLKDAYSFLMDGSRLNDFLAEYILFAENKFSPEFLKWKKMRETIHLTDGRIHRRGARENKFGPLRTEIFRVTRKQIKKQEDSASGQFDVKIFQVVVHLNVRYAGSDKMSKLRWVCQCLGDISLGQILRWYRTNCWGESIGSDQFKFFFAKPHFGLVDQATLVGQCTQINSEQCPDEPTEINITAEVVRGGFLQDYVCSISDVTMEEKMVLARVSVKVLETGKPIAAERKMIVPIDECFVDFIESLGMHSKVIPTFKLLLFNTKSASINSDVIELPLSLTLRNVTHIYGKPPDNVYRLILVDKECFEDWKETNEDEKIEVLEHSCGRAIANRNCCGDEHFEVCSKKHTLLWHGRLVTEFFDPAYLNLLLYSCGTDNFSIFTSKTKMVLGLQIPVAIKMRIIEEFLKDGNRLHLVLAPQVDVLRKQDASQHLLQRITMCSLLLLTAKVENKWCHAFILCHPIGPYVFIPRKQSCLGQLIATFASDSELLDRIEGAKVFVEKLSNLNTVQITRLETIRPLHFKYINGVPFARPTDEGIEGIMLLTLPAVIKKIKVIQMLSLSFVEVYPRPPLLSNATIDSICSEDRRFLVDFEDDRILKEMFGEDKTIAVATSYVVETENRDFSSHVYFILRYNREQRRIEGFLPQKPTQIKLLQKTLSSTDWIKKVVDDASKKGTEEMIETKPVGQKFRLLNLLDELLSESVEKVIQPASGFSRCSNCSKHDPNALMCGLCNKAWFCNKECYKLARSKHKSECCKIQDRRNTAAILEIQTRSKNKQRN